MKEYEVKVVCQQEISMKIKAESKAHVRRMIEDNEWTNHMEDGDWDRFGVDIKTNQKFEAEDKPWRIRSIEPKEYDKRKNKSSNR